MIFSKKIDEITYEDITRFTNQQVKEGINLDYKRDFSGDLAKTISAFANAHGGVILIGVDDDKDGKPILPARGIPFVDRLEERVTQICVEAISPPIFPEIQICPPVKGNTYVVIRVSESNEGPHAINNREDIYIRTGNITKLENRADARKILWLVNKREKSEALRVHLIKRAFSHFNSYVDQGKRNGRIASNFDLRSKTAFSIIPLFPHEALGDPQEIKSKLHSWHTTILGHSFPRLDATSVTPVEDGVSLFFYRQDIRYAFYNEINQYGLIFYLDDMIDTRDVEKDDGSKQRIDFLYENRLFIELKVFLNFSVNMYSTFGYWGQLELKLDFDNIQGLTYIPYHGGQRPTFDPESIDISMTPETLSYVTSVADIQTEEKMHDLIIEVMTDFDWAIGHECNVKAISTRLSTR